MVFYHHVAIQEIAESRMLLQIVIQSLIQENYKNLATIEDITQDNFRNLTALDMEPPEYLTKTGPVSCHYWRASLGKS